MKNVKEISIKNKTYQFFDGMISIKNFDSSQLKIDKNPYKSIGIYYIGYITIETFCLCKDQQCKLFVLD